MHGHMNVKKLCGTLPIFQAIRYRTSVSLANLPLRADVLFQY